MSTTSRENYTTFLAWVGFVSLYIVGPVLAITALNTQAQAAADSATAAYNEVLILSEIRDTLNCAVYDDRDCFID